MYKLLVTVIGAIALLAAPTAAEDYRETVYLHAKTTASGACDEWKAACQKAVNPSKTLRVQQVCQFKYHAARNVEAFCRYKNKDYTAKAADIVGASLRTGKPTPTPIPKPIKASLVSVPKGTEFDFCTVWTQDYCPTYCMNTVGGQATDAITCDKKSTGIVTALCPCQPSNSNKVLDKTVQVVAFVVSLEKEFKGAHVISSTSTKTSTPLSTITPTPTSTKVHSAKVPKGKEAAFCQQFINEYCGDACGENGESPSGDQVCAKKAAGLVKVYCPCEDGTGNDTDRTKGAVTDIAKFVKGFSTVKYIA